MQTSSHLLFKQAANCRQGRRDARYSACLHRAAPCESQGTKPSKGPCCAPSAGSACTAPCPLAGWGCSRLAGRGRWWGPRRRCLQAGRGRAWRHRRVNQQLIMASNGGTTSMGGDPEKAECAAEWGSQASPAPSGWTRQRGEAARWPAMAWGRHAASHASSTQPHMPPPCG